MDRRTDTADGRAGDDALYDQILAFTGRTPSAPRRWLADLAGAVGWSGLARRLRPGPPTAR